MASRAAASFISQRGQGISMRRAVRRNVASKKGYKTKNQRDTGKCEQICASNSKKQAIHYSQYRIGSDETKRDAQQGQCHAFTENEFEDGHRSCPQCHSDTDLAGTSVDCVRHHAVNSDRGKQQGDARKATDEKGPKSLLVGGPFQQPIQRGYASYRLLAIEYRDFVPNCGKTRRIDFQGRV